MKQLTHAQLTRMGEGMQTNARPYDRAKWNYLFARGSQADIVRELLPYQNADGGLGHGFEADVRCPMSAAIPTAEAIFDAYAYHLPCTADWFRAILRYFSDTVQDTPKYWFDCPREAMEYPHAPWWRWQEDPAFSPNPCGAAASALIRYGTPAQQALGYRVAADCLAFLQSDAFCGDHDTLNLQALVEQLMAIGSPLVTEEVLAALRRRILENTCFDTSQYDSYVFTPLDFAPSPDSPWYDTVSHGVEAAIAYWLDHIGPEGVWLPNFSWGVNSEAAKQADRDWQGQIAVKRAKILLAYGRIA